MKIPFLLAAFGFIGFPLIGFCEDAQPQTGQHAEKFEKQITIKLDYLLYLPQDYTQQQDKHWPLIVFLHGSGERGSDIEVVKKHGPPKIVGEKDSPLKDRFIVVSPQCPANQWWKPQDLNYLLDDVIEKYHVDKDRIYLTGLSMGGYGTWEWAEQNPHRFAAIAPMCGGGNPSLAMRLKDLPIWVFHGEKDTAVPIARSEEMVAALQKVGDDRVKFTKYPDAGHDCWTQSYNNPELYDWFLSHTRGDNGEKAGDRK